MAYRPKKTRFTGTQRKKKGSNLPHLIGAVVALGLLGAAGWWMNRTSAEMAINPETLCPLATGPVAETVILFDLTDPLAAAQTSQLLQHLEREFANAAIGTQFTLGVVSEDPADWGATSPLCKPHSEKDVSALTQNVPLVKQRYDERFLAPLEHNLQRMISASGASSSPIMESLQALTAGTPGFVTFTGPRKIILVSDLLQHSDAMSFYRGDDWQRFAASPAFQRLGRTLDGVDVEIFAVPRVVEKIKDPAVIEDFWLRYFDLQGARLPRLHSLGDL
ncbi:MAG: hypothetical protein LCH61_08565 [Proteobacteria bacterium]|nr:hypothetical protein [Pseudomonadota bacterium]